MSENGAPPIQLPPSGEAAVGLHVGHEINGDVVTVYIQVGTGRLTMPLLGAVEMAGALCAHVVQAELELHRVIEAAKAGAPVIHIARSLPKMKRRSP